MHSMPQRGPGRQGGGGEGLLRFTHAQGAPRKKGSCVCVYACAYLGGERVALEDDDGGERGGRQEARDAQQEGLVLIVT